MSNMDRKTHRIALRVTKKEAEFLQALSGAEGRSVGNLIRNWMFLHYMEKLKMTPEEVTAIKEKMESDFLVEYKKGKKVRGKKAA